jgi:hypothetical protein
VTETVNNAIAAAYALVTRDVAVSFSSVLLLLSNILFRVLEKARFYGVRQVGNISPQRIRELI